MLQGNAGYLAMPRGRPDEASQDLDERRLARPIGTDNAEYLPQSHGEGDVAQRLDRRRGATSEAHRLGQVAQPQRRTPPLKLGAAQRLVGALEGFRDVLDLDNVVHVLPDGPGGSSSPDVDHGSLNELSHLLPYPMALPRWTCSTLVALPPASLSHLRQEC